MTKKIDLDPVSPEELARLDQLQLMKRGLADRLLLLKEEEIKLLASSKRVTDEWNGLFAKVAKDRDLNPDQVIDIDPKTGAVGVAEQSPEPSEE